MPPPSGVIEVNIGMMEACEAVATARMAAPVRSEVLILYLPFVVGGRVRLRFFRDTQKFQFDLKFLLVRFRPKFGRLAQLRTQRGSRRHPGVAGPADTEAGPSAELARIGMGLHRGQGRE